MKPSKKVAYLFAIVVFCSAGVGFSQELHNASSEKMPISSSFDQAEQCMKGGKWAEARSLFLQETSINPENSEAAAQAALCLFQLGETDLFFNESQSVLNRFSSKKTGPIESLKVHFAWVLTQKGQLEEARKMALEVAQTAQNFEDKNLLAFAQRIAIGSLYEQKRYPEYIEETNKILNESSFQSVHYDDLKRFLGLAYMGENNYDQAKLAFDRYLNECVPASEEIGTLTKAAYVQTLYHLMEFEAFSKEAKAIIENNKDKFHLDAIDDIRMMVCSVAIQNPPETKEPDEVPLRYFADSLKLVDEYVADHPKSRINHYAAQLLQCQGEMLYSFWSGMRYMEITSKEQRLKDEVALQSGEITLENYDPQMDENSDPENPSFIQVLYRQKKSSEAYERIKKIQGEMKEFLQEKSPIWPNGKAVTAQEKQTLDLLFVESYDFSGDKEGLMESAKNYVSQYAPNTRAWAQGMMLLSSAYRKYEKNDLAIKTLYEVVGANIEDDIASNPVQISAIQTLLWSFDVPWDEKYKLAEKIMAFQDSALKTMVLDVFLDHEKKYREEQNLKNQ